MTRTLWVRVILLSLGGFFEFYDLMFTGFIAPGLVKSGILTATTPGLFGTTGIAGFVAALFAGLFVGTLILGFAADRFGRRTVFAASLLWYTAASAVMAFQTTAFGLNLWRFLSGIGIGVELVTIDTYLAELVPKTHRGRVFAVNQTVQFAVIPVVAFLAWQLVPLAPLGFDGWRWVVLIGSVSAIGVWFIYLRVPESPRWLAGHGRAGEALTQMVELERRVEAESGAPLPPPGPPETGTRRGSFMEIWNRKYLPRTMMLILFNLFQAVGYYGFTNWAPTLIISRGITVTQSLEYTFLIAIAAPFGPLAGAVLGDRFERKWALVAAALSVGAFGIAFGQSRVAGALVLFGVLITVSNNVMSFLYHAYQTELYPTRIRARAVGFVYSWSRFSTVFSGFVIAFLLARFGTAGVFAFIAGCMIVAATAVALLGPRTTNRPLESISH
ncbi:MAG TPA: MFS transporter [Micropepsaceae bacterium]|nr:MFS transporter [Micropepsaceae bacterium]